LSFVVDESSAETLHQAIRFNAPLLNGQETRYIAEALRNGHLQGDGPFTERCATLLERELGCAKVLLTTSCTHALELAALLLDLKPGDEVIVPSFTFPSTATAFHRAGARLVFVDVRTDTLNIDMEQVNRAVTSRTRAIVPVHYAGVGCDMAELMELAEKLRITIIEDAAHGLFGRYDGKPLGTFGRLGCLSFHNTKNFTSGEGGALLVNDPGLIDRAAIIREKGTNRQAFLDGRVKHYTWVDVGSSFVPSDLLAALLLGQLENWRSIQERRRLLWTRYMNGLSPLAMRGHLRLPTVPKRCDQAFHMFYLLLPSCKERADLLIFLRGRGIEATAHYRPLHSSEAGVQYGTSFNDCPNAVNAADRLLRLPLHLHLDPDSQERVINAMLAFYGRRRKAL
jgi:dTDP-4-amino-4,6-dideoxygalactose transaminase